MTSKLETAFAFQVLASGLPEPEREFMFVPGRRFRADFAWVKARLLVEIEGGVWIRGRHNRGGGFIKDCEKYNLAALGGWVVMRFTSETVLDGSALRMVEEYLKKAAALGG